MTREENLASRVVLVRRDGLVIGQPAHAWVSGQLARAWGNDAFPAPCRASRSASPRSSTTSAGRMPTSRRSPGRTAARSASCSSRGSRTSRSGAAPRGGCSRRAATPRCSCRCTGRRCTSASTAHRRRSRMRSASYLAEQRALQERLVDGLDREEVDRNRRLLLALDRLSLMLCHGRATVLEDVPAARGAATIRVEPAGDGDAPATARRRGASTAARRLDRGARLDRTARPRRSRGPAGHIDGALHRRPLAVRGAGGRRRLRGAAARRLVLRRRRAALRPRGGPVGAAPLGVQPRLIPSSSSRPSVERGSTPCASS